VPKVAEVMLGSMLLLLLSCVLVGWRRDEGENLDILFLLVRLGFSRHTLTYLPSWPRRRMKAKYESHDVVW